MDNYAWGPNRRLIWVAVVATVAAVVWRLVDSDPENRLVAVVLAVACAIVAVLLYRIRVRLTADAHGLVVIGPLRSRRIAWAEVEEIATPRRGRFGRHATWLELEIGTPAGVPAATTDPAEDEVPELLAFGAFDLGTDPAKVGRTLLRLRTAAA